MFWTLLCQPLANLRSSRLSDRERDGGGNIYICIDWTDLQFSWEALALDQGVTLLPENQLIDVEK